MAPLGPWPETRRIAVAVSGGADSLCLAYLARAWGNPLALVVDHRLRPESSLEAADTVHRLAGMGVPARVLALTGLGHGPALAARARAARYAALTEAAVEAGCADLLLGHHMMDQAETVLMRRQSGTGPAGLAAMSAVSERNAVRLVRPLLTVAPACLRATLRAAGICWVEDPSNRDPAALRSRLRTALDDPSGHAPAALALAAEAFTRGAARSALDESTATELGRRVTIRPEGFAVLSPGALNPAALAALIRVIGGNPYPAAYASLARLAANPVPSVLGGVRLQPAGRLGPGLLIVREAAAMAPPMPARPGAIWDRRFRLEAGALPDSSTFGALGADAACLRRASPLPAAVLQTLPALRLQGVLAAVPHIGYFRQDMLKGKVAAPFLPPHVLAGAPFWPAARGCEVQGAAPC